MQDALKRAWNNGIVGFVILMVAILTAAYLLHYGSSPGVAVAVLGLAAAVTAIRELTPLEKFIWAFVFAGLVFAEVSAIKIDRQTQDRTHEDEVRAINGNFATVLNKFESQQQLVSNTLDAATATLTQTQPHAFIQWKSEDIHVVRNGSRVTDRPLYNLAGDYQVVLWFENRGPVDAENVIGMTRVYADANNDEIAPRKSVNDFERAWNSWKVPKEPTPNKPDAPKIDEGRVWRAIYPEEPEEQSFTKHFTTDEINALASHKLRVYFLTRIEYSDATGRWRMDRCKRLDTELNVPDEIYNSCSIFDRSRVHVSNK